jgi:argininosuccinate synthase
VRIKIYKANKKNAGVWSPYSLYNEDIATFSKDEVYNQKDAEGFINLFGLPIKVKAMLEKSGEEK